MYTYHIDLEIVKIFFENKSIIVYTHITSGKHTTNHEARTWCTHHLVDNFSFAAMQQGLNYERLSVYNRGEDNLEEENFQISSSYCSPWTKCIIILFSECFVIKFQYRLCFISLTRFLCLNIHSELTIIFLNENRL